MREGGIGNIGNFGNIGNIGINMGKKVFCNEREREGLVDELIAGDANGRPVFFLIASRKFM